MDRLGPFEPRPHLAAAVSGGADSLALAVLARDWAAARGGRLSAFVVDHGLRGGSDREAEWTARRLTGLGIAATILSARLSRGPSMAQRARRARYRLITEACAERGILHLLVGHHRADQAETFALRRDAGSGAAGLAAMSALVETAELRLLRPLLDIPPGRLRATLHARDLSWIEDPSNVDVATPRAQLRALANDADGAGEGVGKSFMEAARHGADRSIAERDAAIWLARHAQIRPEGYALLDAGPWEPLAIGALLRMLAGADHSPASDAVGRLAAAPRAATLGGVRIMSAGKWRPGGWLLVREEAAMARTGEGRRWDGRFRIVGPMPAGACVGPLGRDAARLRGVLPSAALRTLPTLRDKDGPAAVNSLHMSTPNSIVFAPPRPAACAPFARTQPGC